MSKLKMPWKKNFRRIPDWIMRHVGESSTDELIVASVKKISPTEIATGKYAHLGFATSPDGPTFPASILPHPEVGRYSDWNLNGRLILRRDLPKVSKSFGPYQIPIYGKPERGYCDITFSRPVYQRELVGPKRLQVEIQSLEREPGTGDFIFRFQIGQKLNRADVTFNTDLLFALNLLQENAGCADAFAINATPAEFLGTITVNWEILPPGEDTRMRILSSFSRSTAEVQSRINSRYDMLTTLSPIAFINGTNGFDRYFGAKFSDRLVVFENVSYGNAAYAMDEVWPMLSQLPRLELLKKRPDGVTRIIHVEGWENRLRRHVTENR